MSTTTRGYGTEGAVGVVEPAVLVGATAKKSSVTASVMPYALTLVAGIVIGLIAVYATGSVKVGEGSQKVGYNYLNSVEPGMTGKVETFVDICFSHKLRYTRSCDPSLSADNNRISHIKK